MKTLSSFLTKSYQYLYAAWECDNVGDFIFSSFMIIAAIAMIVFIIRNMCKKGE